MEYSKKEIEKIFPIYWKEKKEEIKYFKKGREVFPDSIEKCIVTNLEEGEYDGDCNFIINLDLGDVYVNNHGEPTKGKAVIKIGYSLSENSFPIEVIEGIKDNRIDLL